MSLVYGDLQRTAEHPALAFQIKPLESRLESLRTLAESVRSLSDFQVETDALNVDGPKFAYVMGAFIEIFKSSAREAGCSEFLLHSTLMIFADNLAKAEPEIRKTLRNTGKVAGSKLEFTWPQDNAQAQTKTSNGDDASKPPAPTTSS